MTSHLNTWADDTLAVVALYQMRPCEAVSVRSFGSSLEALGSSVDLLIYDNSSTEAPVETRSAAGWRTRYLHDPSNPGVGAAYNAGAALARTLGKRWLLLLDQDTQFPSHAASVYAQSCDEIPCNLFSPILSHGGAVYSPCHVLHGRGRPAPAAARVPGIQPLAGLHVLNSGLLVQVDLFDRAGGYDSDIRLDFSDFAFLYRVEQETDRICILDLVLDHGLSSHDRDPVRVANRFVAYCEGAIQYGKLTRDWKVYRTMLLRSLRLSLRFKSPRFLLTSSRFLAKVVCHE